MIEPSQRNGTIPGTDHPGEAPSWRRAQRPLPSWLGAGALDQHLGVAENAMYRATQVLDIKMRVDLRRELGVAMAE